MTNPEEAVVVTAADREAAAACYEAGHPFDPCCPPKVIGRKMRAGQLDGSSYVQAFARHRLTAAPPVPQWRLVESAPVKHLVWCFEPHSEGGFMFSGWQDLLGRWWNNLDDHNQSPTHWMPPPAAPSADAAEVG